jgi:hypothetical protein
MKVLHSGPLVILFALTSQKDELLFPSLRLHLRLEVEGNAKLKAIECSRPFDPCRVQAAIVERHRIG